MCPVEGGSDTWSAFNLKCSAQLVNRTLRPLADTWPFLQILDFELYTGLDFPVGDIEDTV